MFSYVGRSPLQQLLCGSDQPDQCAVYDLCPLPALAHPRTAGTGGSGTAARLPLVRRLIQKQKWRFLAKPRVEWRREYAFPVAPIFHASRLQPTGSSFCPTPKTRHIAETNVSMRRIYACHLLSLVRIQVCHNDGSV